MSKRCHFIVNLYTPISGLKPLELDTFNLTALVTILSSLELFKKLNSPPLLLNLSISSIGSSVKIAYMVVSSLSHPLQLLYPSSSNLPPDRLSGNIYLPSTLLILTYGFGYSVVMLSHLCIV